MEIHTIGIALGKTLFYLVGVDSCGNVVARKRVSASSASQARAASEKRCNDRLRTAKKSRKNFCSESIQREWSGARPPAGRNSVR